MNLVDWSARSLGPDCVLRDVLRKLDEFAGKACVIADESGNCLSVFTQGDVRRFILGGANLDDSVASFFRPFVHATLGEAESAIRSKMIESGADFIPFLDRTGRLCGIWVDDKPKVSSISSIPTLVLAGGRGVRLRPLTLSTPKPLVEVSGVSLLERNLLHCRAHGFKEFFISVNYLGDKIKDYFAGGGMPFDGISFLEEETALGTAGPIGLLPENLAGDLLVVNADVLHKIDLTDLASQHVEQKADLTVVVRVYRETIPFGVVELDGGRICGFDEKPVLNFPVSAGIYFVGSAARALVEPNRRLDMPDLIAMAVDKGMKVEAFLAHEYWLDVGTHENLAIAERDFSGSQTRRPDSA